MNLLVPSVVPWPGVHGLLLNVSRRLSIADHDLCDVCKGVKCKLHQKVRFAGHTTRAATEGMCLEQS